MRVLVAGFGDARRFAGMKGLEFAPLSQASDPTEYDFVFLRPSLFGGIFSAQEMNGLLDPSGNVWSHKWQDAKFLQSQIVALSRRLPVLGLSHGLVVVPSVPEITRYYEPRSLDQMETMLNQTLGRNYNNFIERTVWNLGLFRFWELATVPAHGNSSVVSMPGHPLSRYISTASLRWDASFDVRDAGASEILTVATDRSGSYKVAVEVSAGGSYLYGIPEPAGYQDLSIAIECLQSVREWHSGEAEIRSGEERELETRIREGQDALLGLTTDLGRLEGDLSEARRRRQALIASHPEIAAAVADYRDGREQRSLTLFWRAYDRLTEAHPGDERALTKWLGISEPMRREFGRITNQGERHAPRGGLAPQPNVSDEEFERARSILQEILERYLEKMQQGD